MYYLVPRCAESYERFSLVKQDRYGDDWIVVDTRGHGLIIEQCDFLWSEYKRHGKYFKYANFFLTPQVKVLSRQEALKMWIPLRKFVDVKLFRSSVEGDQGVGIITKKFDSRKSFFSAKLENGHLSRNCRMARVGSILNNEGYIFLDDGQKEFVLERLKHNYTRIHIDTRDFSGAVISVLDNILGDYEDTDINAVLVIDGQLYLGEKLSGLQENEYKIYDRWHTVTEESNVKYPHISIAMLDHTRFYFDGKNYFSADNDFNSPIYITSINNLDSVIYASPYPQYISFE